MKLYSVVFLVSASALIVAGKAGAQRGNATVDGTISVEVRSNPYAVKIKDVTVDGEALYLPSSDKGSDAQKLRAAQGDARLLCAAITADKTFEFSNIPEVALHDVGGGGLKGVARFTDLTPTVSPNESGTILVCLNVSETTDGNYDQPASAWHVHVVLSPGNGRHVTLHNWWDVDDAGHWSGNSSAE
jgi:hypothetical protein